MVSVRVSVRVLWLGLGLVLGFIVLGLVLGFIVLGLSGKVRVLGLGF